MDARCQLWLRVFSVPMFIAVVFLPIQLWWFLGGGGTIFDLFIDASPRYAHPLDWLVAIVSILGALFAAPFMLKGKLLPTGSQLFFIVCLIGMNILAILLEWGKILPGHGAVMSTMVVTVASIGNASAIIVFIFGKEDAQH